ncbi:MAG TPA: nickel-binding protein [Thermoleophilaceae bacterium]|nr:nickel-binding protein [Thermoleophilaceae bacterium]
MPRYVIERDFGQVSEDDLQEVAARSKMTAIDHFPDIRWEHSHVCAGDDGAVKSFCVYEAPGADRLREHADQVGGHEVISVYEIVGDLTPEEVRV